MTPDTDTRTCGQDMGHRTRLLETDRTQVGDLRRRTSESCDRPENVNKSTVSSKNKAHTPEMLQKLWLSQRSG